jgi:DNA-binding transcriptional regulator YiaG
MLTINTMYFIYIIKYLYSPSHQNLSSDKREGYAMEKIGERLREFRKASGLSVTKVASHVGVSESTYRDWEHGRAIVNTVARQHLNL